MADRKKLGDLLIEGKVISPMQLQSALAHQKQWGGRLGSALIEKGFVTDDVLAKFLSFQLNVPSVNLSKVQVSVDVLDRIPRELREKHFCAPIAVMKEGTRETVIVAMADPTDLRVVDEIGFATGLKMKPVIATELSLKRFLFGEGAGLKNFRDLRQTAAVEGTEDFEMDVVQGSVDGVPLSGPQQGAGSGGVQRARSGLGTGLAPGSTAPIGESTIDLEPEDLELSPASIVPLRPAAAAAVAPAASASAAARPDPFLAAVRANASGAPIATPTRTPVVMGSVSAPVQAPWAAPVEDDRTEPEIEIAAAPPAPEPAPEPAPAPAPEGLLQDAWGEQAVIATGVMPAEDSVPEISLPGPEYPTPDPVVEEWAPAEAAPEDAAPAKPAEPEPEPEPEFGFDVPPELELAEGTNGFFAATAPSTILPEPESFEPAAEAWAEPEPAAAPMGDLFADTVAAAAAEPASDESADREATLADTFPVETWSPDAESMESAPHEPAREPDAAFEPAPPAPYSEDAATAEGQSPSSSPTPEPARASSSEGAVPVMTMLGGAEDPSDMERTQLGQGAFEPTWTGADELSMPAATATVPSAPVSSATPATLDRPPSPRTPEPSRTVESPIPPRVTDPPRPIVVLDEQVALNATIAKKLKLLNAIAELLLEKGLITEEEIKEKISRKK